MTNQYQAKKGMINIDTLIFFVLVAYYLLSTIMPFVSQSIDAFYYMVAVLLLYLIVFFQNYKSFDFNFTFLLPFLGIVFIELIYFLLNPSDIALFVYDQLLLLLPPVLCYFLLLKNQRKIINWFLFLVTLAFFITAITSYIGLKFDPSAARWLATVSDSHSEYFISLNFKNIGGFETVYSIVLLYPILICQYKQKRIKGYLFFPIVVSFYLYLISAQYTIAIILFFCSSTLFLFPKKLTKKQIILLFIGTLIIILLISPLLGNLLYVIANEIKSVDVASRLNVIGDILKGISNTTGANTRQPMFVYDLNLFLRFPLFGSGKWSGHSYIFDILAKFGVIGGGALFIMYRQIYRKFYLPFQETKYYGYILFAFLETLFLSAVNPSSWLLLIAFIIPLVAFTLQNKQYKIIPKGAILIENSVDN